MGSIAHGKGITLYLLGWTRINQKRNREVKEGTKRGWQKNYLQRIIFSFLATFPTVGQGRKESIRIQRMLRLRPMTRGHQRERTRFTKRCSTLGIRLKMCKRGC